MLDAALVRRWCAAGLDALRDACDEIDALNVFPVPDGDTGTNLLLTMQAAVDELPTDELADLAATMQALAHGSLVGARGNSGVILSQLLRGLSEVFATLDEVSGADLQRALHRAADCGYAAVAAPVEGTLLSVARAAAVAAAAVDASDVVNVADAAAAGAAEALAATPGQLEALARAGVVDAGGRGLVVLLDALVRVLGGADAAPAHEAVPHRTLPPPHRCAGETFGYEIQYLLDAPEAAVGDLRRRLVAVGDSVLVAGGPELWNVHVHADDVGAAIEAGVEAGRPHRIRVTRFADRETAGRPAAPCLVVAVASGAGLRQLLAGAGAVVVDPGPTGVPSAGQLRAALESRPSDRAVVLPNHPDAVPVAVATAESVRRGGRPVVVVPTRSSVQGIAALAVHDPRRPGDDDVVAMSAAAGATRYAAVTRADRDAQTSAGVCRTGDVLGLVGDDVVAIGSDPFAVAVELLDRMLIAGGELVTVVTGVGAPAGCADRLVDYLAAVRPVVETVVHDGGQAGTLLLVGVE